MKVFPPLANLLAIGSENPARLGEVERHLRASSRYTQVWRPHSKWVAASAALHGSLADEDALRDCGLAFAEGRDVMLGSAAERVLRARQLKEALAESPAQLSGWPGDFSFFFFHRDGAATAVRSCAGTVPIYYAQSADGVALATQCDALIRYVGLDARPDPLTAATWTLGFPSFLLNRAHVRGMCGLMPGEVVKIAPGTRGDVRRYWLPMPARVVRPDTPRAADHQEKLRAQLLKRLAEDLDPAGGNLLMLSGGVDSSALLALAGRVMKVPVMTWSLLPPVSASTRTRELSYIEPLRQWAGVTRHWQKQVDEATFDELYLSAPEIPFVVLHPALCSLGEIVRQAEVKVMFGGEFADEICGARLSTPDWVTGTTLGQLLASYRSWPFGRTAPLRWLKGRALNALGRPYLVHPDNLPAMCPPTLQAEYQDFLADLRRWVNSLPVQHRYMFTRQQTIDFAPQNWEVCSYHGIRRSIPFLSRELIELTMDCHPSELIGTHTKLLLRGALHDDVPHQNLYRPDKGDFGLRLQGVKRSITDLELDDEQFWGELDAIVSPKWRRAVVKQGWLQFGDKYPLLYLRMLLKNLKATVKAAREQRASLREVG